MVKKFFYAYVVFYGFFLLAITSVILLDKSPMFEDIKILLAAKILNGLASVCVGILIMKNIALVIYNRSDYIR